MIARASAVLEDPGEFRDELLYFRGFAYFGLGWFGSAEADLAPLGDFTPPKLALPASMMVKRIAKLRRLAPSHVQEVRSGSTVLFRVYYDDDNMWTRALLALLPEARRLFENYWGAHEGLTELPAFVFRDQKRLRAFVNAIGPGRGLGDSGVAAARDGILAFCEEGAGPAGFAGFRSALLHEYSHFVHRRLLGHARTPVWLEEGTAQVCAALAVPDEIAQNERAVKQIADAGEWLPYVLIINANEFQDSDTHRVAYVQSFAMTRYLLGRVGPAKVAQLLEMIAAEPRIDPFLQTVGISREQFYKQWLHAPS